MFKPTTDLHNCNTLQWAIQAHRIVKNTGEYNYQHARIRVPTELHINNWRQLCSNYHDPLLLDYLEFGFPLCIDRSELKFTEFVDNHHSAVNFPHDMDAYFTKELSHKAIAGPCINLPFKVHHSPMLSRPKVNDTRRVIVNLSHPYGNSINDCISNQCHDGIVFNLKYPTVDSIIDAIREKDGDVLLSKIDISRAFRNLRLDPCDYDLMGLSWDDKTYLDISLPMGAKTGSALCQRVTDVIRHIMASKGVTVFNYIDDVICVHARRNAHEEFNLLHSLFEFLGLPMNPHKVQSPTTELTCMGIQINVVDGVAFVPQHKCTEILDACRLYLTKRRITRKQLQSLLGKLLYLHRCVRPARTFVNRLLNKLRQCRTAIPVCEDMKSDLLWFLQFMERFNGRTIFNHQKERIDVHVDASLTGMGAIWQENVYAASRPMSHTFLTNITQLEMANVLVALRCFCHLWNSKAITIHVDNKAVVMSLKYGRIKNPILQALSRSIWLIVASYDIDMTVKHIAGSENCDADILSRVFEPNSNINSLSKYNNYVWWPINGNWCIPNLFM